MGLDLGALSDEMRLDEWVRIVRRIADEHIEQGWNHYVFRLIRTVFANNPELSREGGFIMAWIADNYAERALMLVRRELDTHGRAESLVNLLLDMSQHPRVLTRLRHHRVLWHCEDAHDYSLADYAFEKFELVRFSSCPDNDHLDPAGVQRDSGTVRASAERLRKHAQQTLAHRTPQKSIGRGEFTYGDLHRAICDIREVVLKYYTLLTSTCIAQWEPVAQFNVVRPFTQAWVHDPESFRIDESH
ncbi:MAG TPA: hypothetical protein VLK32_06520 [Bacillota bacterium]|nr:hypothetical protein [Bacillota bacterium]